MTEVLDQPIGDENDAAQRVIEIINVAPKAIKSDEEYEKGMVWVGQVVKRRKAIEAFFETLKKPLRLAQRAIKDKEDSILAPLAEEERKLKGLTGAYFMKKKAEADAKQATINAQHAAKVQAAIDAGKSTENIAPPRVIDTTPATTVKSANGGPTATMRLVKNWRVTKVPTLNQQTSDKIYRCDNPALLEIPDTAWVLDTARANAIAKSGMSKALELYDVPSQAVSG